MDIGIIGSGNIGGTVAELFARAGHEVVIGSRRPEAVDDLPDGVRADTVEEAAEFGEIVLVAVPLHAYRSVPAEPLAGKIVVDANNYYPRRDGQIVELDEDATTSSELLVRHLPDARVVKAFNTMRSATLESEGRPAGDPERLVLFVAGDDAEAKGHVAELIDEIGFEPVDTGGLADGGRLQQPGTPLYGQEMSAHEAREALGIE